MKVPAGKLSSPTVKLQHDQPGPPQVDSQMACIETRLDFYGLLNQRFDEMEQRLNTPSSHKKTCTFSSRLTNVTDISNRPKPWCLMKGWRNEGIWSAAMSMEYDLMNVIYLRQLTYQLIMFYWLHMYCLSNVPASGYQRLGLGLWSNV